MKRIDSEALVAVNRALGLTGAGSQVTDLTDGIVSQVLTVNEIARRSRTQAQTTGIYDPLLQNIHGAADDQVSSQDPYDVTTGRISPYPGPIPPGFDVWFLGCAVHQLSGTGTLVATVGTNWPDANQGWGVDSAGAAVTGTVERIFAHFTDLVTIGGITWGLLSGDRGPWKPLRLRVPRGGTIIFRSTSSAIATFEAQLLLGVFPAALGQDVLT